MREKQKMSDEKQKIEPGSHKTKIRNWGLRETKSGNVQAYIGFANGATFFQMVGSNETGDEILARTLTLCGFKGADLPDLFEDDALDKNREIEIFVKYTPDKETGKPQMQVYVNDPGKQMKGAMDKKGASAKLKELKVSLKKELKVAQSEVELPEVESKKEETKAAETDHADSDEEIPF